MYRCKKCGSTRVMHALWVELNTCRIAEPFGTWNQDDNAWCPDCETRGTIEEVPDPPKESE